MASMLRRASDRTPVKSVHADSLPVHTVSPPLRISVKAAFLSDVNETRTRLGRSVEAMAACAGVSISAMSDALAGKDGRPNFAGHWLIAQGHEFEDTYNAVVEERRGVTPQAKRSRVARDLGELVRRVVEQIA